MACTLLLLSGFALALGQPDPEPTPIGERLHLQEFKIQAIEVPAPATEEISIALRLGDQLCTLDLNAHSMRAPGFRVRVQKTDGRLHDFAPPLPTTYRGTVAGGPGGSVAASVVNGSLSATIRLDEGTVWHVQPLRDIEPEAPAAQHVVYRAEAVLPGDWHCGVEPEDERGGGGPQAGIAGGGGLDLQRALVAFDTDVEYFERNQESAIITISDIEGITNFVSAVYEEQVGIEYAISEIIVRTAEPDPYEPTDSADLLGDFVFVWNSEHSDVLRDTAHLMTGKNLDGSIIGRAFLSVACSNLELAYGLSQAKFSANLAARVGLVAHELGHNWSATHCGAQGGQCSGPFDEDCAIMCACLGACTGDLSTFGAAATGEILNHRDATECVREFDCNANGIRDDQDISAGDSADQDGNGVPDECECPSDITGDGDVDVQDLVEVVLQWGTDGSADLNQDGTVDVQDLTPVVLDWGSCPVFLEGACCFADAACEKLFEADCGAQAGVFLGAGTFCAAEGCAENPDCPGEGDCFTPHGTTGCELELCCTVICNFDVFCCMVEWDTFCAGEAAEMCE